MFSLQINDKWINILGDVDANYLKLIIVLFIYVSKHHTEPHKYAHYTSILNKIILKKYNLYV